ncbi:male sterility protein [Stackebrandtia albiflava]|uniref:Male sterility protein n=1 Tax=Stackebrandtia albiflava TaxID=406432 RepID=A0A562V3Y7_9ACTN|nr:SDR family oxidoreductase [Stackebrandtia albiflava]TWJ12601.1 male sterility protein [Stackebrandtia albiflava]
MRPTIVVTGLSGVVGSALYRLLATRFEVIALRGRRVLDADCEQIPIDLSVTGLGLTEAVRDRLAARADVVLHAAGDVRYTAPEPELTAVNVGGTAELTALAEAAGCPLVYVSSAYVRDREAAAAREPAVPAGDARPSVYLASKAAAEEVVRRCGRPYCVVRPSAVMADTVEGDMPATQNAHLVLRMIATGDLPAVFLRPDHRVDMIPRDVLAAALTGLVSAAAAGERVPTEYWATAGPAALTAAEVVAEIGASVTASGGRFTTPRFLDPFGTDARDYPGWDSLDARTRRGLGNMFAGALPLSDTPFPTSLGTVPGTPAAPDAGALRRFLRKDVDYALRSHRRRPAETPA